LEEIDRESEDLDTFRQKVKNASSQQLEKDLAGISGDVEFLNAQVEADLRSYSPVELEKSEEKISRLRQKADIIKFELSEPDR